MHARQPETVYTIRHTHIDTKKNHRKANSNNSRKEQIDRVMAFLRTAIRCSVFYRKYGLQGGGGGGVLPCCFQKAAKSSAAASAIVQESATSAVGNPQPQKDPLDITFEDAKAAFKSKTNWELIRAYIVYTLCSFDYLVENNMKVSQFLLICYYVI